jgi:hypothetical protein
MGRAAQLRVKEAFTHEHMVQQTVDLYNHHLSRFKTTP